MYKALSCLEEVAGWKGHLLIFDLHTQELFTGHFQSGSTTFLAIQGLIRIEPDTVLPRYCAWTRGRLAWPASTSSLLQQNHQSSHLCIIKQQQVGWLDGRVKTHSPYWHDSHSSRLDPSAARKVSIDFPSPNFFLSRLAAPLARGPVSEAKDEPCMTFALPIP